jgi:AmmeMemoRadiSam system protein B
MIKPSYYSGSFYPENKEELLKQISSFLDQKEVKPQFFGKLKALIVPHAGYVYSGVVAGIGYRCLQSYLAKNRAESLLSNMIVVGPSHQVYFDGIAYADYDAWETPFGIVKIDNESVRDEASFKEFKPAITKEHSIEVQAPFIQGIAPNATITGLVTGEISESDYSAYAEIIGSKIDKNFLVISSDLSHYMPYDEAVSIDRNTISQILNYEIVDHEQACGADGINILSTMARNLGWKSVLLDYRNSGDTAGDKDAVVGYCAIGYYEDNK